MSGRDRTGAGGAKASDGTDASDGPSATDAAGVDARDTLFTRPGDRTFRDDRPDVSPDVLQADLWADLPDGSAGSAETGPIAPFRFDATVARVFPDMLDRSIPGYASIVAQTGLLASRFARPDTRLYDLGCSLAASALAMRAALTVPSDGHDGRSGEVGSGLGIGGGGDGDSRRRAIARTCRIDGIDNSRPMLERAAGIVGKHATPAGLIAPAVRLHEADLATYPLERCSVVAMNFTLQFVAPDARAALLARIADALVPGGALILSEKVRFADPALDALHIDMYHAFKRANGYSALEVARKRAALEDVLVPDTLAGHEARLAAAGFARTSVWFQCFNFVSLVAIR